VLVRIKANTDAFKNLATEEDLAQLMHIYMEYFSPIDDDDTHALSTELTLSFGLTDTSGGDLGMEVESKMEPGILADRLGFLKQHLPHQFNQYRHHSSTPWDNPDLFNAFPVPDCLQPLRLHWHQLAGVHSIIRNTFTKVTSPDHCTGTLICDEVGLGKTALAITTMAFLSQCALLQAEGGDLPPILGEYLSTPLNDLSDLSLFPR
jgi:TATA-binding protein-associated factor